MRCRYPIGRDSFCGKFCRKNGQYCPDHQDVVNANEALLRQQDQDTAAQREEVESSPEGVAARLAEAEEPDAAAATAGFRKINADREAQRVPRRGPVPPPPPEAAQPDPAMIAQHIVEIHLAREAERRFKRGSRERHEDGTRVREGEDKIEPWQVIPRILEIDETAPVDPVTGGYPSDIKPGWVTHWVTTRDAYDRPTTARVARRERYGYVPVRDAEGEPIEGRLGLLMQAPPQASAAYTLAAMPQGAMKRDEALAQAQDIDADVRAYGGEGVGGIVVHSDHKHRRGMVSAPTMEAGIRAEYPE